MYTHKHLKPGLPKTGLMLETVPEWTHLVHPSALKEWTTGKEELYNTHEVCGNIEASLNADA